jgi:group II intron reverse transcriptase/maturase
MNGPEKSHSPVVPAKSPNKAAPEAAAEGMEGRGLTKGNLRQRNVPQTQGWEQGTHSELARVREKASKVKNERFTSLLHHVYDEARLSEAFRRLKRDAAPGVDRVTWDDYARNAEANLRDLSRRLRDGAYRAKPVRRTYIPKADGRQRPLGVTVLEDKVVQRALVDVLNAVYETDFLGFSYGFRPGRSQHRALDALFVGFSRKGVNWVLDADIRGFFDAIDHEWMVKFLEHRIADKRIVRLVQKWLNAGVLEDGTVRHQEEGTPQGGCISPLLANIYLHYVLDLWVQKWRKTRAQGEVVIVRYADDFIVGFQRRSDATSFQAELRERLSKFNLELHPEKTRLLEFGRFAAKNRQARGQRKPETFNFLGFTHICGTTPKGEYVLLRQTMQKRLRAKLHEVKDELKRRRHDPVAETGKWLRTVVRGHYQYYGVPTNFRALSTFRFYVVWHWGRALRRRGQKHRLTWERMYAIARYWLPLPKLYHGFPRLPRSPRRAKTQGKSRMR